MDELTKLIIENQRFIYYIANKFPNYPNKEDLFQVGAIGFQKGYKCYDPSRNVKLTTHLYKYIFGEMSKFIQKDRSLKCGRDLIKIASQIEKTSILLTQRFMREPSLTEVCAYLGIEEKLALMALESNYKVRSTDEIIYQDGKDRVLGDFISDTKYTDIDSLLELKEALSKLGPKERLLIQKRYFSNLTQSETAKELGMSQVQVSRKESKILEKMRSKMVA